MNRHPVVDESFKQGRVHIIGIGSPHGMDRLAWQLVEQLHTDWPVLPADLLELVHQYCATPAQLPELVSGADMVVLVDAVRTEDEGVGVRWLEVNELARTESPYSSHGIDLPHAVALTSAIGVMPARWRLLGLCVGPEAWSDIAHVDRIAARLTPTCNGAIHCYIDEQLSLHDAK